MPYFDKYTVNRIERTIRRLKEAVYSECGTLSIELYRSKEPLPFDRRMEGEHLRLQVGEQWGELWDCAWFHFTGTVPKLAGGYDYPVLLIDISGEGLIVDGEGTPIRGITNVSTGFDSTLGAAGKRVFQLKDTAPEGGPVDLWMDAGCNDLFGEYKGNGTVVQASVAFCNERARQLYYDYTVLYDLYRVLPEDSARRASLLVALDESVIALGDICPEGMEKARKILAGELNKKGGDPSLRITAIGHAHLDLAWLWPLRETLRKGARTFSTALEMMERYPDYVFGASQAQLYDWMKNRHPSMYARIKERVAEGRWEVQGPTWVEMDTNIVGGESMVRQFLYGKRFFFEEFHEDIRVLWLPDVFGYSAALPQIMKKSGVDYFMTQKMSWNEINRFPHQTFLWQGLDGTTVLTHMLPEETYNAPLSPTGIRRAETKYIDKGRCPEALMLFGIGDGGGGPGPDHLERAAREKDLNGLCPVTQGKSSDFFRRIDKYRHRYKTWNGELYLERHQGTYTTQAKTKYYNRRLEQALRDAEFAGTLAAACGMEYPKAEIDAVWKEMMLYQFHDIIPGSSIKRVYDECVPRYQEMLKQVNALTERACQRLFAQKGGHGLTAFNPLSCPRREAVEIDGAWYAAQIPAMGSHTFGPEDKLDCGVTAESAVLENDRLKLKFAENGRLLSVFDKECGREVLAGESNALALYDDPGDAWDIDPAYQTGCETMLELVKQSGNVTGPYAELRQEYRHKDTTLTQTVRLTQGSARIDFITFVNWQEKQKMLRANFRMNVKANEMTCGIQFGSIKRPTHRNTTWDAAKFEICAQKWVDLSEPSFGAALLNDSKYGHSISENRLSLNLLRSPNYPGKNADLGEQEFRYALLPHSGNESEARVWEQAEIFNSEVLLAGEGLGSASAEESLFRLSPDSSVVISAVKPAENGRDTILRLYEAAGSHAEAQVEVPDMLRTSRVELVNLLESMEGADCETGEVYFDGQTFRLSFTPFEVKTIALRRG